MSLAAGTRLGSDEIIAPLGAGGMGEVPPPPIVVVLNWAAGIKR